MTAILLASLFAVSGIFALATLRGGWKRHGADFLSLRDQLRDCPQWREVTVTTRTVTVHPGGAVILRPEFKRRAMPGDKAALPAAA
jgi:hypothetical protein